MVGGHRFDAQTLHSFIQAVFRQMGSEEQRGVKWPGYLNRGKPAGMVPMVLGLSQLCAFPSQGHSAS